MFKITFFICVSLFLSLISGNIFAQGPWIMEWYALDPVRGTAGIKDGRVTDWIQQIFGKTEAEIANVGKVPLPTTKGKITIKGEEGDIEFKDSKFIVKAGGADIWNKADAFRFTYKEMRGNFDIVMKAESLTNTNDWAKIGPMVRQSDKPESQYVFMLARAKEGNKYYQERMIENNNATGNGGKLEDASGFPVWLRIVRQGDDYIGAVSPDGKAWKDIGTTRLILRDPVLAGLAVTSHATNSITTGVVSSFTIGGKSMKLADMKSEDIGIVKSQVIEVKWAVRNLVNINDNRNLSNGIYQGKYGDMSNYVFYGIVGVISPKAQDTILNLAQDDDAKVWINGNLVIESVGWTGGPTITKPFNVRLNKGLNIMMVKVSEGGGGDYLNARFDATDLEFTTKFSGGMSVSKMGKLSSTWGNIKNKS